MSLLVQIAALPASTWLAALGYLVLAVLLLELVLIFDPYQRWRLRHIPGPPAWPLIGCMPEFIALSGPKFFSKNAKKYGPVFKVALGRTWLVVVTDPDLMRQVGYKLRHHVFIDPSLMRAPHKLIDEYGLFRANDDYWRMLRSSWQPAFSAPSLAGYLPRMATCAAALTDRLAAGAAGAKAGTKNGPNNSAAIGRVDMWRQLGAMTLQVVGSTAYGVDFLAESDDAAAAGSEGALKAAKGMRTAAFEDNGSAGDVRSGGSGGGNAHYGAQLARACADVFRYSSAFYGSWYSRLAMLFPEMKWLLAPLAHAAPDRPFKALLQARTQLLDTCLDLIRGWKQQHSPGGHQPPQQAVNDNTNDIANGPSLAPAGPEGMPVDAPPTDSAKTTTATAAVEPGSFLGLMLAARDKSSGQRLTDLQVISQAQLFILAGYETTANALAFAVYGIATHPEVERRLVEEVDSVLGPDPRPPNETDVARLPYTEAVFQEALRLYPSAPATNRDGAREPIQVGSFTVPPHTPMILGIYSAHTDPEVWPRPLEFIPERFLPSSPMYPEVCAKVAHAHAPFGYGSRMCIGWKFAIQEAKVALATLYHRLRFELEPGQVPLRTSAVLTLAPKDGVWVRPQLRR